MLEVEARPTSFNLISPSLPATTRTWWLAEAGPRGPRALQFWPTLCVIIFIHPLRAKRVMQAMGAMHAMCSMCAMHPIGGTRATGTMRVMCAIGTICAVHWLVVSGVPAAGIYPDEESAGSKTYDIVLGGWGTLENFRDDRDHKQNSWCLLCQRCPSNKTEQD